MLWHFSAYDMWPPWVIAELNKLVFSFFWSGKWDLVARSSSRLWVVSIGPLPGVLSFSFRLTAVSDLNWQTAHGVLYTAMRLSSFSYSISTSCFCGYHSECLEHLFFSCPLAQSGFAWIGTQLLKASPPAPSIDVRHALFGFSSDELL